MKKLNGEGGAVAMKNSNSVKIFWACLAAFIVVALIMLLNPFHAGALDSLFDQFETLATNLYGKLVAIAGVLVAVVSVWCLIVRIINKNPRTIDEATQWMKRAWIALFIIMILGVGYSLVKQFSDEANKGVTNKDQPWETIK